jgi:thiamine-monophosphate kinase
MRVGELGEFVLIERLAAILAGRPAYPAEGRIRLGIGDDAAVLEVGRDRDWVATTDTLIEGVHFRREWTSPEDLGWKALAVNVSDLGAMGAAPTAALVCIALPTGTESEWIECFYRGMADCAAVYGCPIAGGDTVRSPSAIAISVTAVGAIGRGAAVTRSGAGNGDLICVTGTLGDSAAGLALLAGGHSPEDRPEYVPLFRAHLRPAPPVGAARALARGGVSAMMDLSDGLASDLARLSEASGAGGRVFQDRLPISLLARGAAEELNLPPEEWAVRGGEDYEYLFTVAPDRFAPLPALLAQHGVTATIVGEICDANLVLVDSGGEPTVLPPPAFSHFD